VYSDELVDQGTSLTDREQRFGLLRNDWSPKPAYTAMRNLLALASDPGPSFTRHVLAYGLAGAPSDLRQSLVQRRDGSYTLFLWRDDKIWDPKAGPPLRSEPGPAPAPSRSTWTATWSP